MSTDDPASEFRDERAGLLPDGIRSPHDLVGALGEHGYLADLGLATAGYLSLSLARPLFLEGEPGVGKTEVGKTLARLLDAPLIRMQCYEGIDVSQALYDWDFPRQLLHLRSMEAVAGMGGERYEDVDRVEGQLYDRRFLVPRPLLEALETTPSVLLIDEVDRADDEFEAFLLEILSDFAVSIPEIGTIRAKTPPAVVLTSNRTREVHDALKRRCLYHWLDHPTFEREVEIVRMRLPEASERLTNQVIAAVHALREADLVKPPGVAETLDWTQALVALDADELDAELVSMTIGSALKYHEDQQRAQSLDLAALTGVGPAGS